MHLTVRNTNPAAVLQDSALQGDRRAPSTLAAGDESPMNSRERGAQRAFYGPGRPGLLRRLPHERTGAGGKVTLRKPTPIPR